MYDVGYWRRSTYRNSIMDILVTLYRFAFLFSLPRKSPGNSLIALVKSPKSQFPIFYFIFSHPLCRDLYPCIYPELQTLFWLICFWFKLCSQQGGNEGSGQGNEADSRITRPLCEALQEAEETLTTGQTIHLNGGKADMIVGWYLGR
jgi:hypothetical protein